MNPHKFSIKKIYDSTNNSRNTFANLTSSVFMENTTYFYTSMLTDNIVGTTLNTTFEDTNSVFDSLLELNNLSLSSRRNNISFRETTDIKNSKEKSIELKTFFSKEEKKEVNESIDTSFCSKDQGFIYYQNFLINLYYQNFLINKNPFFEYLTLLKNFVTLFFSNFNNNNNKIYD